MYGRDTSINGWMKDEMNLLLSVDLRQPMPYLSEGTAISPLAPPPPSHPTNQALSYSTSRQLTRSDSSMDSSMRRGIKSSSCVFLSNSGLSD